MTKAKKIINKNHETIIDIGMIFYHSENFFAGLLDSLQKQTFKNFKLLILINGSSQDEYLKAKKYFKILKNCTVFYSKKNLGFAKGQNFLLKKSKAKFYFCLNPDLILDKHCLQKLVDFLNQNKKCAAAFPKILKLIKNQKTNLIDSCGVEITKSFKAFDNHQNQVDNYNYKTEKEIFAFSGAAVLLRKKALNDVAILNNNIEQQFFDELFFMFKEDVDLSFRLRWKMWKIFLCPLSLVYHKRGLGQKKWLSKSFFEKKNSFLGQTILLIKNFDQGFSFLVKLNIFLREICRQIFVLFFSPLVFWEQIVFFKKNYNLIFTHKKALHKKINPLKIEKFFI